MRTLTKSLLLLSLLSCGPLLACGGDDGGDAGGGPSAGAAGQGGSSGGGKGGAAGSAGKSGAAGQGGAGAAGASGAGAAGAAGGGAAGAAGAAGGGAAGSSGSSGQSGASGQAGVAGSSGAAGAGAGGAAGSAAGSAGAGASGASGQGGSAGQGGAGGQSGSAGTGASACPQGELCDGGVCAADACCKVNLACGNVCCDEGQVCSFGACVVPGQNCIDSSDCQAGEYCERGAEGQGGTGGQCSGQTGSSGSCLPLPPECAPGDSGVGPGGQITCLQKCEFVPPTTDFTPELKYSWGGKVTPPTNTDVMMAPIVIQLDDDDCDGKITERDIPEIVFTTFASGKYNDPGVLHAISVVQGKVVDKWELPGVIRASSELASGNIDGVPGNEVVGCDVDNFVRAVGGDGKELWKSSAAAAGCRIPSVADLDGDGQPEIIAGNSVFEGATGLLKSKLSASAGEPLVADLDSDGKPELVSPEAVFDSSSKLIVDTGLTARWHAIGDLDNDGTPEVVTVDTSTHQLHIWSYDPTTPTKFTIVRQGIDINGTLDPNKCKVGSAGNTKGGGPPTIADFNADGVPDVALAGGVGYAVFDGKKLMDTTVAKNQTFLWVKETQDCSSAATGSSLFDFNGDGKAEVLYGDETQFRIYEGATGNVLYETCNTTGTLVEFPIVADVDNDGQADIIVISNAYSGFNCGGEKQSGVRIFGSKQGDWVRTRRVWNQHAYHITNVNEDGSIPAIEPPNWKQAGLNNFRINKQPGLEFAAPDAVIELRPECDQKGVAMIVRNLGQSVLPPGAVVNLFKGTPPNGTLINEQQTTLTLYPAQSETLLALVDDPEVTQGLVKVYGMVSFTNQVNECRTDNNTSTPIYGACTKF